MLARGAERARGVAASTLAAVYDKIGFLPPPRDRCMDRPPADRAAAERAAGPGRVGAGRRRAGGGSRRGAGTTDAKPSKFEQLRERHAWLDHLVRAGARYTEHHGDHYAAAVTYFSILSLVPLLMIAFAVARVTCCNLNPTCWPSSGRAITAAASGNLARPRTTRSSTRRSHSGTRWLSSACSVALYSGHRLDDEPARGALGAVGAGTRSRPPLVRAAAGRPAVAARAGGRAGRVVRGDRAGDGLRRRPCCLLGLSEQAWAQVLLGLLGFVLGIAANWLVFLWVIARLPREHTPMRSAVRAALLGAVGFEILKQVMTIYLGASRTRPAARSSARSWACSSSHTSCRGSCCS